MGNKYYLSPLSLAIFYKQVKGLLDHHLRLWFTSFGQFSHLFRDPGFFFIFWILTTIQSELFCFWRQLLRTIAVRETNLIYLNLKLDSVDQTYQCSLKCKTLFIFAVLGLRKVPNVSHNMEAGFPFVCHVLILDGIVQKLENWICFTCVTFRSHWMEVHVGVVLWLVVLLLFAAGNSQSGMSFFSSTHSILCFMSLSVHIGWNY